MPCISSTISKNISLALYLNPVALQGIGDEKGVGEALASLGYSSETGDIPLYFLPCCTSNGEDFIEE